MQTDKTSAPGRSAGADGTDMARLSAIVRAHDGRLGSLVAILQDVQAECGYLPESALRAVSELTGRPLVDVFGVATFYSAFSLTPRGRHVVAVCQGTACHVRGSARVLEELERRLGVGPGETTPDGQVTLQTVNCLGACALGPVVLVDGTYHPYVDTAEARRIAARLRRKPSAATVTAGSASSE
jgi:NADH-quinone oxidoreductase subunit E